VKLLVFIASLQCGGAERVSVTLCNHWTERGWDVTLATFDDGTVPPFFPPARGVRHVTLGLQRRSTGAVYSVINNVKRVPRLRRFVAQERPDCILSFIDGTNVLALLAAKGTGIPVVVSERVDPSKHEIPWPWRVLRRLTYPWARAIVVQTGSIAAHFPASWRKRIAVIPNPVPSIEATISEAPGSGGARLTIVGMGRLEPQKGFDLLIQAFASIAATRPEWDLTIFGEGNERSALTDAISRFGLSARIALPGREPDAPGALRRADLFVLSSRYEGFPNVLCEAMACGLPVIAFDCPSGPADIVRDGIDGLLVPAENVGALAAAMASLMADEARRAAFGGRAPAVASRFSVERIAARWERVLRGGAPADVDADGESG
jgi:GalNAc-alpha-(1->4)-GalNAc-alpha-(1->3)-diNAcBac-PP-undecaprenol alpha-1,4-N-acetyl-D-galactosaminyltransferase